MENKRLQAYIAQGILYWSNTEEMPNYQVITNTFHLKNENKRITPTVTPLRLFDTD